MCRFYKCHTLDLSEDAALDSVDLLVSALAEPTAPGRMTRIAGHRLSISRNDPRLTGLAEQEYAAMQTELYNDWIEDRAAAFRRQIVVTNVAASCPL